MKKFQFKLRAVKRLKELKLEEKERELVTAKSILESERRQLRTLFEEKAQIRANRNRYQVELNFMMVEFSRKYEESLAYKISSQELRVAEAHRDFKESQEQHLVLLNEKRIMDRLEEVEFKKFKIERGRFEQKQTDDINSLRYARRLKNNSGDGDLR